MRRRKVRPLRDYERIWKGRCVDKNLKDEWLERLNNLMMFDLNSICEGHSASPRHSHRLYPHMYLKLKPEFAQGVVKKWTDFEEEIKEAIGKLFTLNDTLVDFEISGKLKKSHRILNYSEKVSIRIKSHQVRVSEILDDETGKWFIKTINRVEDIDSLFFSLHQSSKDLSPKNCAT